MMESDVEAIVVKLIEGHMKVDHYPLSHDEISALIKSGEKRAKVVERVVEMLEGKPVLGPSGHIIDREDGLFKTVQKNNALLVEIDRRTNGGITVTQKIQPNLSKRQKGYIWGFAGTVLASIIMSMTTLIALVAGG